MHKNSWRRSTYLLQPSYAWYPLFFGQDTSFTRLEQTAAQEQAESLLFMRLMVRYKFIQWQLETGKNWQRERLNSSLHLQNEAMATWSPDLDLYQNDLRLRAPYWFVQNSATCLWGPLLVRTGLRVLYQPVRLKTIDINLKSPKPVVAEPQIDLRYTLNERSMINGFYRLRQDMPRLNNLYTGYLFIDYQQLDRGLPDLGWQSSQQAELAYRYNNRLQLTSWNVSGRWMQADNAFGTQYAINPYLIVQEAFRPVQSVSYSLNGSGDRYFKDLSMRMALGGGFSDRRERAKINSQDAQNLDTRNYLFNVGCGTAFNGWINFILDNQVNKAIISLNAQSSLQTTSWFSTLQVVIKPLNQLQLKLFIHHAANRVELTPYQHFFAADGFALLRLPKWHSEVQLTAFNLLGSQSFEQVGADAFIQSRSTVSAVTRFFMVSWGLNF